MASNKMSIARAFTTKRNKQPLSDMSSPARSQSTRKNPIKRSDISSPIALISTTNMLSYNAPDVSSYRNASGTSSASSHSSEDSDARSTSSANDTSLTDASSVGSSPVSPNAPKNNHLSGYFAAATNITSSPTAPVAEADIPAPAPRRSASTTSLGRETTEEKKPAIPQRALSHSKASHEHLARQRSLRNSSSSPRLSRTSREQGTSVDTFKASEDPNHPFGKELEQLQEVVEEFGGVLNEASVDEDYTFMQKNKLAKFNASEYMQEIQPLYLGVFNKQIVAIQTGWI